MKTHKLRLGKVLMLCIATFLLSAGALAVAGAQETEKQSESETKAVREIPCGVNGGNNVTATLDDNGILTLSGTGETVGYAEKGKSIFYQYRSQIKTIIIGDGVTSIGAFLFDNVTCSRVQIGAGVRQIGKGAFYRTYDLYDIDIPGNVAVIGEGAFRASNLVKCTLHEGLQVIGDRAFYKAALPSSALTLPESVKEIGKHAFANTRVAKVTIPIGVLRIGSYAFGKVNAVIYTPNATIEDNAFGAGSALTVRVNSTADAYAKKKGLKVQYLECEPPGRLPVLSHMWSGGTITKQPTCVVQGERTYQCLACGATRIEYIPCVPHTFGGWAVLSGATVFEEGVQGRSCLVCGYMETSTIARPAPVIQLNVDRLYVGIGSNYRLQVIAKGAGDAVSSWESTNSKIASVSPGGKVKGKRKGTVTITVRMDSGISASVKVTVKNIATQKLSVKASGAKIKSRKVTVKAKKTFALLPKVSPANATDKVTFSSSNKKVAAVSSTGKVTAKKKGTARITVKSGRKRVVITVTVK